MRAKKTLKTFNLSEEANDMLWEIFKHHRDNREWMPYSRIGEEAIRLYYAKFKDLHR